MRKYTLADALTDTFTVSQYLVEVRQRAGSDQASPPAGDERSSSRCYTARVRNTQSLLLYLRHGRRTATQAEHIRSKHSLAQKNEKMRKYSILQVKNL